MTNNNLRAHLISEIDAMEDFFKDLPDDVRDVYGLDNRPLTVRFGPDVETVFVDEDGRNLFGDINHVDPDVFVASIHRQLSIKEMVSKPTVVDEDAFIEIRLRPSNGLRLCEDYEVAQNILHRTADDIGTQAHGISAHWHMSIVQGGADLYQKDADIHNSQYSDFFKNVVAQLLTLQERFSAFHIRPFRAEQNSYSSKRYKGPRYITYNAVKGASSITGGNTNKAVRTIESRISPDDPYQAAYLNMRAVENVLRGDKDITSLATEMLSKDKYSWLHKYLYDQSPADPMPIRRGAGGYLEMLVETARSLEEYSDVFPKHIAHGMMRASIEGYDRYFDENSKAKPDDIPNLGERLWALKQKFSEPQAQSFDAELVVT